MRVAIYAIACNEEKFVQRWAHSAMEADHILLADTGSTDNTRVAAGAIPGVTVRRISVDPWRFDDARNAALALLPADIDYCVTLDLDEVLAPGWRHELTEAWHEGITRPQYRYVWSWNDDGTPGVQFWGDRIHARHGYRWRHPCHETLYRADDRLEKPGRTGLEIHHHPDKTKSRGDYLGLLALAVAEDPDNDRMAHYYARELMYRGQVAESIREFQRHLSLPRAQWAPERAASMRYIALMTPEPAERQQWLLRAVAEAPLEREGWLALAEHQLNLGDRPGASWAASRGLSCPGGPGEHYISDPKAWDGTLERLAGMGDAPSTGSD